MRIKALLNIGTASGFPAWCEGDEVEADDKTASALIARGWAMPVKSQTEPANSSPADDETKPSSSPLRRKRKGD